MELPKSYKEYIKLKLKKSKDDITSELSFIDPDEIDEWMCINIDWLYSNNLISYISTSRYGTYGFEILGMEWNISPMHTHYEEFREKINEITNH